MELDYQTAKVDHKVLESYDIESVTAEHVTVDDCTGSIDKFGNVTFKLPVLFIHEHEAVDNGAHEDENSTNVMRWGKNVCYFLTYSGLYHYCNTGDDEKLDDALSDISDCFDSEYIGSDPQTVEDAFDKHIRNRIEIFENMDSMYSFNRSYFENNPPMVGFDPVRKKWNVIDGSNRIAFLKEKGENHITCKAKSSDFKQWETLVGSVGEILSRADDSLIFSLNNDIYAYAGDRIVLWKKILGFLGSGRMLKHKTKTAVLYPSVLPVYLLVMMDADVCVSDRIFPDPDVFRRIAKAFIPDVFSVAEDTYIGDRELVIAGEEALKSGCASGGENFRGCLILDGHKGLAHEILADAGLDHYVRIVHITSYYEDKGQRTVDAFYFS